MSNRDEELRTMRLLCVEFAQTSNEETERRVRREIAEKMPAAIVDQLRQLVERGPVEDGDVISKADRGYLMEWGLATRVMVRGAWGYTGANYLGGHVYNSLREAGRIVIVGAGG